MLNGAMVLIIAVSSLIIATADADTLSKARKALEQGKYDESTKLFGQVIAQEERAQEGHPKYSGEYLGALWGLAITYYELGKYDECVNYYEKHLQVKNSYESSYRYEELNKKLKKYKPKQYDKIQEQRAKNEEIRLQGYSQAHFSFGKQKVEQGKWDEAIPLLSKVGETSTYYQEAQMLASESYFNLGKQKVEKNRWEEAVSMMSKVGDNSIYHQEAQVLASTAELNLGKQNIEQNKWEEAISALSKVGDNSTYYQEARSLLEKAQSKKNQLDEYQNKYLQGQSVYKQQKWANTIYFLGEIGSEFQYYKEVQEMLQYAYYNQGLLYFESKDWRNTIVYFNKLDKTSELYLKATNTIQAAQNELDYENQIVEINNLLEQGKGDKIKSQYQLDVIEKFFKNSRWIKVNSNGRQELIFDNDPFHRISIVNDQSLSMGTLAKTYASASYNLTVGKSSIIIDGKVDNARGETNYAYKRVATFDGSRIKIKIKILYENTISVERSSDSDTYLVDDDGATYVRNNLQF